MTCMACQVLEGVFSKFFKGFHGSDVYPLSISLSHCLNESDSMLSSERQEASSAGLKGPVAEVAQLFLCLFKDNLHWEL